MNFNGLLKELVKFDNVFISGHSFPDADSLASTQAMFEIVSEYHTSVKPIYGGFTVDKLNLKMMMEKLNIKVENVSRDFTIGENDLLILVDCQANQSNSMTYDAKNIVVFDHHNYPDNYSEQNYLFTAISPEIGSCSTLIYTLAEQYLSDFEFENTTLTAMLMGLYVDTNNLTNGVDTSDLNFSNAVSSEHRVTAVSNILRVAYSENDTNFLSQALIRRIKVGNALVSFIGDCDNNLLGQLSDFLSEIESTEYVILVSEKESIYRFSIRSYGNIKADDMASRYSLGIGDGGGHSNKAAGVIFKDKLTKMQFKTIESYTLEFMKMITSHSINLVYGKDDPIQFMTGKEAQLAIKKEYKVRFRKFRDIFNSDFKVASLKTLEGIVDVGPDDYLVIGVKGEPYPISEKVKTEGYRELNEEELLRLSYTGETLLGDEYVSATGMYLIFDGVAVSLSKELITSFDIIETTPSKKVKVAVCEVSQPITVMGKYGMLSSVNPVKFLVRENGEFYLCDKEVFEKTYNIEKELNIKDLSSFIKEGD